jgi:uracil-DNA glycosylase
MTWSEQQRAMLAEMGIRVWHTEPPIVAAEPELKAITATTVDREGARSQQVSRGLPTFNSVESPHEKTPGRSQVFSSPSVGLAVSDKSGDAGNQPQMPAFLASSTPTADVMLMDWPQLHASVAHCTACVLCESRTQTVFGVGHQQADWLIVGEAPGEQEDRQGEPFVGKSGQLLDNMLSALRLSREPSSKPEQQVFIANTIKCRPPSNRNPLPEELAKCEPYLIRQVALIKPKIILAMGRFAVQSLLRRSDPIGRLRGQVHHYQNVPLIVTYHPAYLLRNPEDKAKAWEDLCLAMSTYQASVVSRLSDALI